MASVKIRKGVAMNAAPKHTGERDMKENIIRRMAAAAVLVLFAVGANGQVAVQWGPGADIVTGLRTAPASSGSQDSLTLNLANPASPTGADYYAGNPNPTDRSAKFYATVKDTAGTNAYIQLANNYDPNGGGAYDALRISTDAGAATAHSAWGVIVWQKSDGFLNGFNANTVDFSNVTLSLAGNNNSNDGTVETRIVVRQGASDFYISNSLGAFAAGSNGWTTFTHAGIASWSAYDPVADISVIGAAATPTLNNVTAVGFYYSRTGSSLRYFNTSVREFTMTVIPEPASAGLLLVGVAAAVAARRRRR